MQFDNIAFPREIQGDFTPEGLEFTEDGLTPDSFPVELVELSDTAVWALKFFRRRATFSVHRIVPCPYCQAPVVCLHIKEFDQLHVCDAIEESALPGFWTSNLFDTHRCEVRP